MKKEEARMILNQLGMPAKQQADLCAYTILALANIRDDMEWSDATNEFIRIHDVLQFTASSFFM